MGSVARPGGEAGAEREIGQAPKWVASHQRALSIATVVLGVLALALWTRPTWWVVIFLVVAVLLVVGAIRLLAEVGRRADLESIHIAIDAIALEYEAHPSGRGHSIMRVLESRSGTSHNAYPVVRFGAPVGQRADVLSGIPIRDADRPAARGQRHGSAATTPRR